MGKKHREELTPDRQLELMLETTELASIYTKDPDEDVLKGPHPIEKSMEEHRKKKKKKEKKKNKNKKGNGLELFTTESSGSGKGKQITAAINRAAKNVKPDKKEKKKLRKDVEAQEDALYEQQQEPQESYYATNAARDEEIADRIVGSFLKDVTPQTNVQINANMVDPNTVCLLSLNMVTRELMLRNLDGDPVFTVKNHLKSDVLTEMLREVLTLTFTNLPRKEPDEVDRSTIPEPKPIPEEELEAPIVEVVETVKPTAEPPQKEEPPVETKEKEPAPLTSRIQIPQEVLNQIPDDPEPSTTSDLSSAVSNLMDEDEKKSEPAPASGSDRFIIHPHIPEKDKRR